MWPDGRLHSAGARIAFTHCDDLPFIIETSNDNFEHLSLKGIPAGISCTTFAITGHTVGTSEVSVSYTYNGHTMVDHALIGAYRSLTVMHPVSGETVLAKPLE
jgi:hypothetical protein